MLPFWCEEIPEPEDDGMSNEEIESAFVSWWAPFLHWSWMGHDREDGREALRQARCGEVWK